MRKIRILPRTFNRRIFLVLSTVIFIFSVSQILIVVKLWPRAEQERIQRLNWGLASSFARRLRPLAESGASFRELTIAIAKLSDLNPEVDVFLLDQRGYVISPTRAKGIRIPTETLEHALEPRASRSLPIYGPHPLRKDKREYVFSVSRFRFSDIRGYLYVSLVSRESLWTRFAVMDFYIFYAAVLTSICLGILALILGALLTSLVTRRFRVLADTVGGISQGNLNLRIPEGGDDELGELSRQINEMTDTIVSSLRKSEKNDRLRRDLVASISHDLRGPVTSLNGYVEQTVTKFGKLSEDQKLEKLQVVLNNGRRLSDLINQLFELSKLDANEKEPDFEAFSILDLVLEEIVPKYEVLANEKSISLIEDVPEELPRTLADFQMIYRVLSNLVQNAVSYTQSGGTVTVKVKQEGEKITVSVADNGPGIPEKDLTHIFNRFYIPSKARTKGHSGSGLGLAIVKKIIDAHKEEIRVDSIEGQGTTFSFSLAVCKQDL